MSIKAGLAHPEKVLWNVKNEFGIHAFLASNTVTNEYYPMLAKILFEVAKGIASKIK